MSDVASRLSALRIAESPQKQTVTKEEAQSLRASVLRANRPLNPWAAAAPLLSAAKPQISPPISTKTSSPPSRPTAKRTVVKSTPVNSEVAVDNQLKALEQLEIESRKRQTAFRSDSSSSPSSFYFSDDGESDRFAVVAPQYPLCFDCENPICDLIVKALGENYHPECFRCSHCGDSLNDRPFATSDGRILCVRDYEQSFVPLCSLCRLPIRAEKGMGESVRIVAADREYHLECYQCEQCRLPLSNDPERRCFPIDGHLLCRNCNQRWRRFGGHSSPLTDL